MTSPTPDPSYTDSQTRLRRVLQAINASTNTNNKQQADDPTQDPASDYAGLPYWYPPSINSENFDLGYYLSTIPNLQALLPSPLGRKTLTYADPLLFALTYLPHHLRNKHEPTKPPSFADPHFEWCRLALRWALYNHTQTSPTLTESDRNAYISPRETGKTTWWFLIIPMWAAAHGHKEFIAAFAHAKEQAEAHLRTFKAELEDNRFLREDYPDLCRPRRTLRGQPAADRVDAYTANSGFTFRAKGIDSSSLGMKDRERRPDLLLLDDVEPDEAKYNAKLVKDRLGTILEAIIPLNIYASFVMVGTVTMPDSIVHQLVKYSKTEQATDDTDADTQWIRDWQIKPHHYQPITGNPPRSIWPDKWPLDYLLSIAHTRSYAKNYANDPKGVDGDYWNMEDYTYGEPPNTPPQPTRTALFIDPPTTHTNTSDPAGLAIVTWTPPTRADRKALAQQAKGTLAKLALHETSQAQTQTLLPSGVSYQVSIPSKNFPKPVRRKLTVDQQLALRAPGRVTIESAWSIKATGKALYRHALATINNNPHIQRVVIETTQGGDLWLEIFADCPVQVQVITPRESKEVRFARALEYYQKRPTFVYHKDPTAVRKLEEQQMGFPKMLHDDIADAATAGILYFLEPKPPSPNNRTRVRSYV